MLIPYTSQPQPALKFPAMAASALLAPKQLRPMRGKAPEILFSMLGPYLQPIMAQVAQSLLDSLLQAISWHSSTDGVGILRSSFSFSF